MGSCDNLWVVAAPPPGACALWAVFLTSHYHLRLLSRDLRLGYKENRSLLSESDLPLSAEP